MLLFLHLNVLIPKLIDTVITEPGIIDIDTDIDIEKQELELEDGKEQETLTSKKRNKKEMYFQRLEKWKGFIRLTFDITKVFDQFQERLREELIMNGNCNDDNHVWNKMDRFNNRRYFVNSNGKDMSCLKWDRISNKIGYDCYVDTYSSNIVDRDFELRFLDRLGMYRRKILETIFDFGSDSDLIIFRCVCKEWENLVVDCRLG